MCWLHIRTTWRHDVMSGAARIRTEMHKWIAFVVECGDQNRNYQRRFQLRFWVSQWYFRPCLAPTPAAPASCIAALCSPVARSWMAPSPTEINTHREGAEEATDLGLRWLLHSTRSRSRPLVASMDPGAESTLTVWVKDNEKLLSFSSNWSHLIIKNYLIPSRLVDFYYACS